VKHAQADIVGMPLAFGRRLGVLGDFVALTKPRLNLLVVLTSAAGYYLGTTEGISLLGWAQTVMGTALVAGGAAVLNQLYERDTDALMRRTRGRPLPARRVSVGDALVFGIVLSGAGLAILLLLVNRFAGLLALATLAVYLGVYTPMKRRSAAATLVGALPGALPPLIGWAAASGAVSLGGWTLFAIVFLWQIPHFMAIAWMCRDDYRAAGLPMLPDGRRTGRQAVLFSALLVPASLLPSAVGVAGWAYLVVALLLSSALLALSIVFATRRSEASARWLFFATITYLPLIWVALILDH
jgi:protoheme IX farnesyltransferase